MNWLKELRYSTKLIKVEREEDTTDTHEYLPYYTCGHFARELSLNASRENITIGTVILGNHPTLRGYQNHIMNYYLSNGTIMLIEPQTDQIMHLEDTMFSYYRLYPNGNAPSNWRGNLMTEEI